MLQKRRPRTECNGKARDNKAIALKYSYWGIQNTVAFSDGRVFFRYLLSVLRLLSSDTVLACIRAVPYRYSGKSRTYKNFVKKIPQNFACSRLGGTTVRKPMVKRYPYHLPFRAKKGTDTKAQKLLRPVLESAAQGLSRAVLSFMIQVHSNLKKHYYFDGPSRPRP